MDKKLIIIFLVAFLVRLINLNQSIWLDEAITAKVVKEYGLSEIIRQFSPFDFHPPLYYWLMKIWTRIFGFSEISLRMPSIIFSLLTGYFIYKIVLRLLSTSSFGIKTARWAVIFFLFNPLIVYYSQEARMYMMVTFSLTVSLYYLILISNIKYQKLKIHIKNQIFYLLFILLSLLTFYGAVFFIAGMLIYMLISKNYKQLFMPSFFLILFLLLIYPLLQQQWLNSKISLSSVTNWSLVLGKANLKNLLLIPLKFSFGRISFYPKWLYYLIAGGWTIFILYQILNIREPEQARFRAGKYQNDKGKIKIIHLLFFLLITPLILGFIISFFTPLLQYFRFLYLVPIMAIFLGFRATRQAEIHPGGVVWILHRVGVGWLMVGGFLMLSLVYLLVPKFHREDWKNLVRELPKNATVYMISSSSDPIKYYNDKIVIKDLRELSSLASLESLAGLESLESLRKILVIPYTAEIYGVDYRKDLLKLNYSLKKEISYRELTEEIWVKN